MGDYHARCCERLGLQCPCLLDPWLLPSSLPVADLTDPQSFTNGIPFPYIVNFTLQVSIQLTSHHIGYLFPFYKIKNAAGAKTTVCPEQSYFLMLQYLKGLLQKMNTVTAACRISATIPAVGYHAYIVYKSKQRMMTVSARLLWIIPLFATFLFS